MSTTTDHPDVSTTERTGITTMRAITQDAYGNAEVLREDQVAVPGIEDDEVLLRVHAAGLDRGTWHLMSGRPRLIRILGFGLRRPKQRVPGIDVAGTVVALGPAVTDLAVGDRVFGIARGSFAEYAAAKATKLAPMPSTLTAEQAAVVPISGLTALQAVCDTGRVQAGQRVLVLGASGGVGSYAVQIAKACGAEVTGVCSTAKLDLVRGLGADHVLDHTRDDFADGTHRYDLIIDLGGNPPLSRLRRALTPTGTAVVVGGEEGGSWTGGFGRTLRAPLLSLFVRQRLAMFMCAERGSDLARLTALIEDGSVTPALHRTYALSEVPGAMRDLVGGHVRGKVAIRVNAE